MANYKINNSDLTVLGDYWKKVPEELRKEIFKVVYKKDSTFLKKIGKGINGGFTPKTLSSRPDFLVTKLDKQLISINGGEEFQRLLTQYFVECNKTINDSFTHNFHIFMEKSPELSCKQITEEVLVILDSEFRDDPLWKLYKKALPICEPSRYSDFPPDLTELRFKNNETKMTGQFPELEQTVDDALTSEDIYSAQDQQHDFLNEGYGDSQNLKYSNNHNQESTLTEKRIKIDSSFSNNYQYITDTNINKIIREVCNKLKTMPIATAENNFQFFQTSIFSLAREYNEYLAKRDELDHKLTELRKLGLIHGSTPNEAFSVAFNQLSMLEASNKLLDLISQTIAILDKYERIVELENILDITQNSEPYRPHKPELEEVLKFVDLRINDLEQKLHIQIRSESLLLDFASAIESCDYITAMQYITEITPEVWNDITNASFLFANFQGKISDKNTIEVAKCILHDPMLMALIVSVIWQMDSTVGIKILNLLEKSNAKAGQILGNALSCLTFEQLQVVAAKKPNLAMIISRLTLLSALAHPNHDAIQWLQSLASYDTNASNTEVEFIRECAISHERGCLVQDLSAAFGFTQEALPTNLCQEKVIKDLQNLAEVHGLGGYYKKLRESAKEYYILPVMRHIEEKQPELAIRLWESYGNYDDMAQNLIKDIESSRKPEQRHHNKTVQYLHAFGDALINLASSISKPNHSSNAVFVAAFNEFNKVAGEPEILFLDTLRSIIKGEKSEEIPPIYFGRIASATGKVSKIFIDPTFIENWIIACNAPSEETNSINLLAERLIHVLAQTEKHNTPRNILDILLTRSEFKSAASLVSIYPEINTIFKEHIEGVKKVTLDEYKNEWNIAHSIVNNDVNVQLWILEIERLIDEYSFSEASKYLPELKIAIQEYNNKHSEEYNKGVNILLEAGHAVPEELSLSELRSEVELLKNTFISDRQHISILENILVSSDYENDFKEEIKKLLCEIDRPLYWLPSYQSKTMSEELGIILKYLASRVRWRNSRPDTYYELSSSLSRFISNIDKIISHCKNNYIQDNELTDLATGIEIESWEADEVLRYLNDKVPPNKVVDIKTEGPDKQLAEQKTTKVITRQAETLEHREIHKINDDTAKEMLGKLYQTIISLAEQEERMELPKEIHSLLRAQCSERKWNKARILAANMLLKDVKEGKLRKLVEAATYSITLTHDPRESNYTPEERIAICLGSCLPLLINQNDQPFYYTDRNSVMDSVAYSFIKGINPKHNLSLLSTDMKSCLASDLNILIECHESDPAYRWLKELMHEASVLFLSGSQNGASILSSVLWDQLTGVNDPAKSRSKMLLLFFRLNLVDNVIANLAKNHALPFDYFIIKFLHAVRSAEANQSAWDEARRLAQSFVEQVPANKLKPWRVMIDTLNRSRKNEIYHDQCSITLENCFQQEGNVFLLELCISPGPYSILESAQLYIGDDTSASIMQVKNVELIAGGEQIASRQISRIPINLNATAVLNNLVIFPYRLVAKTTSGNNIDQRGRWTFNLNQTMQPPLPKYISLNLWKGADGNPVDSTLNAYHGRKKESEILDQLLYGNDGRQKSALVIGQRRIGKTSLLVETLRRYPPKEGHVCGVYAQFGGIQKRKTTEPLNVTVFNALTEMVDVAGYNNEFCKLLSTNLGSTWLRELRRNLNPATSIQAALTTFVDRVSNATNGLIKRMAFFTDEFQAIFKYPSDEIDQVMWGLRPLVQMSSKISLIFAGSGLTRELIRGYDKAFFGSIGTIELSPFSIEDDYGAIADTFLPKEARQYLCPNLENLKDIVQEAYHLTGGHPWYLSMLGRSAAKQLEGRIITPILLKDVAQKMVNGEHTDFYDKEIGAARFYGHLFDSLDSMGKEKAYAQLILSNIARQVTFEWPWLTATQAISGPKIEQMRCSSRECLDALRMLKDEQILDRKIDVGDPKYRIRIPLVAESIRHDADEIEYQAVEMLSCCGDLR